MHNAWPCTRLGRMHMPARLSAIHLHANVQRSPGSSLFVPRFLTHPFTPMANQDVCSAGPVPNLDVLYLRPLHIDDGLTSESDGTVKAGTLQAFVERLTLDGISEVSYVLDLRGDALTPHAYRFAARGVLPTDFLPDLPYLYLRRRGLLLARRTIRDCSSGELDSCGARRLERPQAEARTEPSSDLFHDMAGGPRDVERGTAHRSADARAPFLD
jgi:hypothetical protein